MNDTIVVKASWKTFPVNEEKKPCCKWRDQSRPDYGVNGAHAVDCGKTGLVVIDCDVKNGDDGIANFQQIVDEYEIDITKAWVAETPSGGMHYYFRALDGVDIRNSTSYATPGVDVRANGGYVIVPPSQIAAGTYRWAQTPGDGPGLLPDTLRWRIDTHFWKEVFDAIDNAARVERQTNEELREQEYARAALENEIAILASTSRGRRNEQLNISAFNLGQMVAGYGSLDEAVVRHELFSACQRNGLATDDGDDAVFATVDSGLSAGTQRPRTKPVDRESYHTICVEPVPVETHTEEPEEYPQLPHAALLPEQLGVNACPWLDEYVEFSRRWSPRSYDGYHEAIGLWVLSTVAARRVAFDFGGRRRTNLYIMLMGRTTLYAKSTAAKIGKQTICDADMGYLLASDQATPQAFLKSMAYCGVPTNYDELSADKQQWIKHKIAFSAQRGWWHEEFGSHLEAMMRKNGVMADFRGIIREFDDSPNTYSRETISRGIETVNEPYLALVGNLTPSDLKPVAGKGGQLWGDGFLARFAIVTPPLNELNNGRFPRGRREIPAAIRDPLVAWHRRLGVPEVWVEDVENEDGEPTGRKRAEIGNRYEQIIRISPAVFDAFYNYDEALRESIASVNNQDLDGNYGRFGEKALRIAALFASFANCDAVEVTHFAKAQQIVDRWRRDLHRAHRQVTEFSKSDEAELEDKVTDTLYKHQGTDKYNDGMTAAQISRYVWGVGSSEVQSVCDGMVKAGALMPNKSTRSVKYWIPGVNGLHLK